MSKIEWTDKTLNPVTGCTPCSPGCDRCYAKSYAARLHGAGNKRYRNKFEVACHPEVLEEPGKWKNPKKIFMVSMGDVFHPAVPMEFKRHIFETALRFPQHTYQVLTKRVELILEAVCHLPWPENLWLGATIEADEYAYRAELLKKTPAAVKFLSLEPLIGPLPSLNVDGLDWVIVGGERATGARKMKHEWVVPIRDACGAKEVPFFFKKWGTATKGVDQDLLDGKLWREFPQVS